MTGMIGIIGDHAARYTWFSQCLAALEKPEGTVVEWRVGANRGAMRNELAHACLDQGCDWIFFIDDDQAFHRGVLNRLLAHEQPVVSGLIVGRKAPFLPTAYADKMGGRYRPLDLRSVGGNNLVAVAAVGTGGLLVRSEALRQLDPSVHWFYYSEALGEDLYFCERLTDAGVQIVVDTGCRIGHIAPAAVFPTFNGEWGVQFQFADGTTTNMWEE